LSQRLGGFFIKKKKKALDSGVDEKETGIERRRSSLQPKTLLPPSKLTERKEKKD